MDPSQASSFERAASQSNSLARPTFPVAGHADAIASSDIAGKVPTLLGDIVGRLVLIVRAFVVATPCHSAGGFGFC